MSAAWSYSWKGWNVVEAPKNIAKDLLNLEIYIYQARKYPRLEDPNLYREHISKLLQHRKLEDSDGWRIHYSNPISEGTL